MSIQREEKIQKACVAAIERIEQMEAEIDRLCKENADQRRAIESWKAEEQAWHEERKALAKRAEFWKAETEKRAELLEGLQGDTCPNPECDGEFTRYEGVNHADGCDLARLMTMPEEPKP